MIIVVFAAGVAAGAAVVLPVLVLRWHATVAVSAALLSSLAVTALVVHEATEADGIPPTRYDKVVIAIGAGCGALVPALLLVFGRWLARLVEVEKRLAVADQRGSDSTPVG